MSPLEQTTKGVRLRVKAVPRASRSELAGIQGHSLRIRLAAPPVDGAANEALLRFLSEQLSVPRTAVQLASGHTSRSKVVTVSGIDVEKARMKLGL